LDTVVLLWHVELLEPPAKDAFEEGLGLADVRHGEIEVRWFHGFGVGRTTGCTRGLACDD
jgi:hypothetical protein